MSVVRPTLGLITEDMIRLIPILCLVLVTRFSPADEWPWWRGPTRDGVSRGAPPPLNWSDEKNVVWSTPIPGRGHSTPAISSDHVFLTTADEEARTRSIICLSRKTGAVEWSHAIHRGGFDSPGQSRRSWANSSPAWDGDRVVVLFSWNSSIWATAYRADGKRDWQVRVGDFVSHHGYSASPTVWGATFLIAADHKRGGYLTALDRRTGKPVWKTERPAAPSYVAPIVLTVGDTKQILMSGCDLLASYDPDDGKELWSTKATTTECVGSVIATDDLVYASGGYPDHVTACVKPGPDARVLWTKPVRSYIPSMLVHRDHLFTVTDRGIAYCWEGKTGEEKWKGRLKGSFAASPSRVGRHIYATSEQGTTYVLDASTEEFKVLAENKLGDETFASPVICDGRVYLRIARRETDGRQEYLVCVGTKTP